MSPYFFGVTLIFLAQLSPAARLADDRAGREVGAAEVATGPRAGRRELLGAGGGYMVSTPCNTPRRSAMTSNRCGIENCRRAELDGGKIFNTRVDDAVDLALSGSR